MQRLVQKEHWLKAAKRLPVGATDRIYHGAEKRPNLVIRNMQDKYTAYCHHCHQGDVQMKEAVRFQIEPEAEKSKKGIPSALIQYHMWDESLKRRIMEFLISKDMALGFFSTIYPKYNPEDQRLVFETPDQIVGRDMTGKSKSKWFTYMSNYSFNRAARRSFDDKVIVLTEDYFSALKLQYVFSSLPRFHDYLAVSAMGTRLNTDLTVQLIKARKTIILFDGDAAGSEGAVAFSSAFKILDIPYEDWTLCMPTGLDPKNLDTATIARMFCGQEST
jgi:hypothetical protein